MAEDRDSHKHRKLFRLTTAQATVLCAVTALIGGVIGAYVNARSSESVEAIRQKASLEIERERFESSLILQAIKTPSRSDAIRNLKFFVAAGFIRDEMHKISNLSDARLPFIGSSLPDAHKPMRAIGTFEIARRDDRQTCTGLAIAHLWALTTNLCVHIDTDLDSNIVFVIGSQRVPVTIDQKYKDDHFAVLRAIDDRQGFDFFLDTDKDVRDPRVGERAYFVDLSGPQDFALRTCEIRDITAAKSLFAHTCAGLGKKPAVLISAADNAVLGMTYGDKSDGPNEIGMAAMVPFWIRALLFTNIFSSK